MVKILVTGASGVLGTAVFQAFKSSGYDVVGLANSRSGGQYTKLDLTNTEEVTKLLKKLQPDWVIHCAAERRPDVAEKDPAAAQKLNAEVPGNLSKLAKDLNFKLIYISTDYVFDGTSPPYTPSSATNPVNLYGKSKRDGEVAVLEVNGAKATVLRVPVLYGPAPHNSDSAVNILLDVVQDQSGKTYKMDHYATRYPTNVADIAAFLVRLSTLKKALPPILHYSGEEPFTKYEMCLVLAKILGLPHKHITADAEPPTGDGATSRPRDCHLYTKETEDLGVEGGLGQSLFEEWWTQYLKK
ncbi:hypothetical protein CPB83DRAFT_851344 [Crepidotus variabilis]|uniref:RmlD-like substrate binding domain-containing protein n=1 Tax=Crepidotus variabilis TaxID=179855 RepID=A0A9P6JS88_9AGAR|nr:hypothetical protein CPB83DRAFT_851344 [Crepidotus variabilis]